MAEDNFVQEDDLDPNKHSEAFRINFDNNFKYWFGRNLGIWRSRRQYFFEEEKEAMNIDMLIKIEKYIDKNPGELRYRFTWSPEKETDFFKKKPSYSKEGVMDVSIWGHQLHRSNGYLSRSAGISSIRQVDEHELIFESKYDGWYFLEHTRLIDQDRYRYRVIYGWYRDKLQIVENHHEIRIKEALAPIQESK